VHYGRTEKGTIGQKEKARERRPGKNSEGTCSDVILLYPENKVCFAVRERKIMPKRTSEEEVSSKEVQGLRG